MKYYHQLNLNNQIISIDNVVLAFTLPPKALASFVDIMNRLQYEYTVDVKMWDSQKIGRYKTNFQISTSGNESYWIGSGLNLKRTEWNRVSMDFNPNKVGTDASLQFLLSFLRDNASKVTRTIKRYDLAIDIPVDRQDVILVKDNRLYSERKHGQAWTQYLGAKSSHVGRIKLYNKALEANLGYPLTRLEMTLDPSLSYDEINWPTVYYANRTKCIDFKITDTDKFIVNALLQGAGNIKDLGRKERDKVAKILSDNLEQVKLTQEDYQQILSVLHIITF